MLQKFRSSLRFRAFPWRLPGLFLALFLGLFIGLTPWHASFASNDYFHVQQSKDNDLELKVSSIGGFGIDKRAIGHADLTHIDSLTEGEALTIDIGAGIARNFGATFFFGAGALVGYNWDTKDYLSAIYPETGIIISLGKSFALSLSGRRYYNLSDTDDDENIIMFGLMFGGG